MCIKVAHINFSRIDLKQNSPKAGFGGDGTTAYTCVKKSINVIDCSMPVLSMHAPWEVISKVDLDEAYRCYVAFPKA